MQDVQKVQEWREKENGGPRRVIAVNTSYTVAPWADIVFAMDFLFWKKKLPDIKECCPSAILATTSRTPITGVDFYPVQNPGNSGAGAISLAHYFGATKIILLGYDCKYGENGKRHFFGNHPPGMAGNAGSVSAWPEQFRTLARRLNGCNVLNCTPGSALTVWPLVKLEEVLK